MSNRFSTGDMVVLTCEITGITCQGVTTGQIRKGSEGAVIGQRGDYVYVEFDVEFDNTKVEKFPEDTLMLGVREC